MKQFYVTKKKYDWIVRLDGEELLLVENREDAVSEACARAKAVLDAGGEAEVLVANVVGMWDKVSLSA